MVAREPSGSGWTPSRTCRVHHRAAEVDQVVDQLLVAVDAVPAQPVAADERGDVAVVVPGDGQVPVGLQGGLIGDLVGPLAGLVLAAVLGLDGRRGAVGLEGDAVEVGVHPLVVDMREAAGAFSDRQSGPAPEQAQDGGLQQSPALRGLVVGERGATVLVQPDVQRGTVPVEADDGRDVAAADAGAACREPVGLRRAGREDEPCGRRDQVEEVPGGRRPRERGGSGCASAAVDSLRSGRGAGSNGCAGR